MDQCFPIRAPRRPGAPCCRYKGVVNYTIKQFGLFFGVWNSRIFMPTIVYADKTPIYKMIDSFICFKEARNLKKNIESDVLGERRKKSDYLGSRKPKKIENHWDRRKIMAF